MSAATPNPKKPAKSQKAAPAKAPPSKTTTDWKAVEQDYRAGIKSVRQIATEQGVSHVAIAKRAKRDEWHRDLAAKIKASADAMVTKAAVTSPVTRMDENAIVHANASQQASIRIRHQANISRTSNLFLVLLGELEVTSNSEGQGLIEALMDACRPPKDNETEEETKRRKHRNDETLQKVLSLPGRIESGKRLVEILERLTMLERIAHGIKGDEVAPGGEVADFIKSISRAGSAFPVAPEPAPVAQTQEA